MSKINSIAKILMCLECGGDLVYSNEDSFLCKSCKKEYPIIDGIPRFVDSKYWKLDVDAETIQEKTNKYFGFEWDYFSNWGFLDDKKLNSKEMIKYQGGTIKDRISAFNSKCRLSNRELTNSKIILDAGCGNGRYTYEAAKRTESLVIGIDIGYGSVQSAYKNTKKLKNVIIMQCDLFNLPFKNNTISACFSNGVLMHTGNAQKSFFEICRTIQSNGIFVAHLYNKLNPIWELNDYILRSFTKKLSIDNGMKFAVFLSNMSKKINKLPNGFKIVNYFFRLQPTVIHMYDWYSAPIATHHTYKELNSWFIKNNFKVVDKIPKLGIINKPWAINLKGVKK